jgi:hypothetical protein
MSAAHLVFIAAVTIVVLKPCPHGLKSQKQVRTFMDLDQLLHSPKVGAALPASPRSEALDS